MQESISFDAHMIKIFLAFIQQDSTFLLALSSYVLTKNVELEDGSRFEITPLSWQFTLSELCDFCRGYQADLPCSHYSDFRTQLFKGSINHELGKVGGKISLAINMKNVDTSSYILRIL